MYNRRVSIRNMSPFFGVLMIIITLFIVAFSKMTVRKISYSLHRESRVFDELQDKYYQNLKKYGQVSRTERLEKLARRRFFDTKNKGQIIHVIDGKIALPE